MKTVSSSLFSDLDIFRCCVLRGHIFVTSCVWPYCLFLKEAQELKIRHLPSFPLNDVYYLEDGSCEHYCGVMVLVIMELPCRGGLGNGGQWVMPIRYISDKLQHIDAFVWCCHLVLDSVKCES
jgi:hypothetical protein